MDIEDTIKFMLGEDEETKAILTGSEEVEEPKQPEEEEVVDALDDIVNDIVQVQPEVEEPIFAPEPEVEIEKPKEAVDVIYEKLHAVNPDVTREWIKDTLPDIIELVDEGQKKAYELKTQLAKLEAEPGVKAAKIARQVTTVFNENHAEWTADFADALGDVAKDIQKLGKKKTQEFEEYLLKESSKILTERIKNNKPIVNPLLLLAPKIVDRVRNVQKPTQPQQLKKTDHAKNLMSLESASPAAQQIDTKNVTRRSRDLTAAEDTVRFMLGLE